MGERFDHYRRTNELPDVATDGGQAANFKCPTCGGALVDRDGDGFECDDCGQVVFEEGGGAK